MKTTTITEAKNGLSALIDQVRQGESILITDRGVAVAWLEPVTRRLDSTGRIRRLERAGVIRAGAGDPPKERLRRPAHRLPPSASAVRTLLDERRSSR